MSAAATDPQNAARTDADLGRLDYAPIDVGLGWRLLLRGLIVAAVVLVLGLQVPSVVSGTYELSLLTEGVLLGILALGIGFLAHRSGLVSLGHTAFYGTAAYLVAIGTSHWGMGAGTAALIGVLGGTLLAVAIGALVVRTPGMGFLMLTLAFGQALYQLCVLTSMRPVTGAYDGLTLKMSSTASVFGLDQAQLSEQTSFWPVAWIALVLVAFALWVVGRSRLGLVLEAIRENEERARFSGYNTYLPRLIAFAVSGASASIAGVLFALHASFVSPDVLSFATAGNSLIAAIVGGIATLVGPVVGAILYIFTQNEFGSNGNVELYTGIALVVVLAFIPGGIVGGFSRLLGPVRRALAARVRAMLGMREGQA